MATTLVTIIKVGSIQEIRTLALTVQNRNATVQLPMNPVTQECFKYQFQADSTLLDDNENVIAPIVGGSCLQGGGRWLKCLEQDPVVWKVSAGVIHPVDLDSDVAIGGTVSLGKLTVHGDDVSQVTTVLRGADGQAADIFNIDNFAGTKFVRINAAGFVGIGGSPSLMLHVIDNNSAIIRMTSTDADANASAQFENDAQLWQIGVRGTLSDSFVIRDSTFPRDLFRVTTSGATGIGAGASAPTDILEIVDSSTGTITTILRNINAGASAGTRFFMDSAGGGDTLIVFNSSVANDWAMGMDNDDGDAFKISDSTVLGVNDRFSIRTSGATRINQWLNLGTTALATSQGDAAFGISGQASWDFDASAAEMTLFSTDGVDNVTFTTGITGALTIVPSGTTPSIGFNGGPGVGFMDFHQTNYRVGADNTSGSRTDATNKLLNFVVPHYTNAEQSVMFAIVSSQAAISNLVLGGGTSSFNAATNIAFYTAATNTTLTGTERMCIASDGAVGIAQWLNVGTAGSAADQGDVSFGLSGGNELLWDESNGRLDIFNDGTAAMLQLHLDGALKHQFTQSVSNARYLMLDSGGATSISLNARPTLENIFNEQGADINYRIESDDEDHVFAVDAGLNNLVFCHGGGSMPGFNSMDGGLFLADANVVPTGNPTGGGYMFSQSGAAKWRSPGGTTTTFGPAHPHCPRCGRDFTVRWEHDEDDEDFSICYPCLVKTLDSKGVDREDYMITDRLAA